jgi:hypothetical protein
MSLSAKREALARIHGRYERAGRPHKTRILEEFCATCGYHRKAALRLLNRPLRTTPPKRSGPKLTYDPLEVLPVLKTLLAGQRPALQQAAQGRAARMARTSRAAHRAAAGSF